MGFKIFKFLKKFIPKYVKTNLKIFFKKIKIKIPHLFLKLIKLEIQVKTSNDKIFKYYTQDLLSVNSIGKSKVWEPHIIKFSEQYIKDFKCNNIVDIGAHIGYHSLNFSTLTKGNVYSFEPQPQNFTLLKKNILINQKENIYPYMVGLSDQNNFSKIPIVSKTKKLGNMGDFTLNNLNTNFYTKVPTRTLDSFQFGDVSLIKIDVQGWEKKVLLGAKETILKFKPTLIIEFERHQLVKTNTTVKDLVEVLEQFNYKIFYLEYLYPSDHICIHKSNLKSFKNIFNNYIYNHNENNSINENFKLGINKKIVM